MLGGSLNPCASPVAVAASIHSLAGMLGCGWNIHFKISCMSLICPGRQVHTPKVGGLLAGFMYATCAGEQTHKTTTKWVKMRIL